MLEFKAVQEIDQSDALTESSLISQNNIFICKEGLFQASETLLLKLEQLETFALEDGFLNPFLSMEILGFLAAALGSVLFHE